MAMVIINGRRVQLPSNATEREIRRAGGIGQNRTLIRRTREGNYAVSPDSRVPAQDGDVFIDAPRRIKG